MWTAVLFFLSGSCSCESVLDWDSVHAFIVTVDLFTALRDVQWAQTQQPCQNWPKWSCEGWCTGLGGAKLCNSISFDMWDQADCYLTGKFNQNLDMGVFLLGNLHKQTKDNFDAISLWKEDMFNSVCQSLIRGKQNDTRAAWGETLFNAGEIEEKSEGKQHKPPPTCLRVCTWCRVCEFRRPRLQRNTRRVIDGEKRDRKEKKKQDPD